MFKNMYNNMFIEEASTFAGPTKIKLKYDGNCSNQIYDGNRSKLYFVSPRIGGWQYDSHSTASRFDLQVTDFAESL